jgi:DNA-binding MarR family transcriptional regulator
MDAVELYLLGRKLMKIGEGELPKADAGGLVASVRMILIDVSEHPDSSIGEIASRTGFPQSHVSASVARLRDRGALETSIDPSDGRRTLARLAPGMRERATRRAPIPVNGALSAALDTSDPGHLNEVLGALEVLTARLTPRAPARVD